MLFCLTDDPRDISITVTRTDHAMVLTCLADASPAPVYQWTDLTSNFTSNDAVISLNINCPHASTTLTCAAVGNNGVSVTDNVTVNWTYSQCGSKGTRHSRKIIVSLRISGFQLLKF